MSSPVEEGAGVNVTPASSTNASRSPRSTLDGGTEGSEGLAPFRPDDLPAPDASLHREHPTGDAVDQAAAIVAEFDARIGRLGRYLADHVEGFTEGDGRSCIEHMLRYVDLETIELAPMVVVVAARSVLRRQRDGL